MPQHTLEDRVSALEELVRQILSKVARPDAKPGWRSTIGMFAGDPIQKEIDEAGRKVREADRRRAMIVFDTYYERLVTRITFFSRWRILSFDRSAADEFTRLRRAGVRIGMMDLKIAAIALVHDATLPTANTRDFGQVPGLTIENWLD